MTTTSALSWTLRSIARLERAAGVRAPRLTEPEFKTWHRFRRKLGWVDFIELLHEDLADAFPEPFDLTRWETDPLQQLDDAAALALIQGATAEDKADDSAFLRQAAVALGLPQNGNIADLPRVQPRQRALELPGAGGRIAAYQVRRYDGLALDEQFTFVAATPEERILIGLATVERRANAPRIITPEQLRREGTDGYDCALGIGNYAVAKALAAELGLEVSWS